MIIINISVETLQAWVAGTDHPMKQELEGIQTFQCHRKQKQLPQPANTCKKTSPDNPELSIRDQSFHAMTWIDPTVSTKNLGRSELKWPQPIGGTKRQRERKAGSVRCTALVVLLKADETHGIFSHIERRDPT